MKTYFNTILWGLFALFMGASLFFTISVERFKSRLNTASDIAEFTSGQKVLVLKIIDGDEISVKMNDAQFIVRILGIRSYEPAVNDPVMENVARDSMRYLEKTMLNNEVMLVFEKFQKDKDKRVLAYVFHNGADAGLDMVANGLSIVFTRYHFSRIDEYLKNEKKAIRLKKGLWGVPSAADRSLRLKNLWKKEKDKES